MKSKIVENWLTKVTELTFTVPFCQLLLSKGQRVVHISSQGPMEQGKDVIAVDPSGMVHCYQLKCGNINSRVWAGIKAEIDQLVELPPRHPSLDERVEEWEAYLVTNGTIANPTARDIHDYSESKSSKGHRPLKTIVGGELVADFTKFYDDFLPVDAGDLQWFLELYNQPGDYEFDLGKFKLYFEKFFLGARGLSRQKKVEAIRASLVLCGYLQTNKYSRNNHLEILKGFVLVLATIYEFAESQGLADSKWRDTERLAYEAINIEFRQLIDDLASHPHAYAEAAYGILPEVITYSIQCTELLGYLAAYTNYCALSGTEPYNPGEIEQATTTLNKHGALFGECQVPLLVNHIIALDRAGRGEEAAKEVVGMLLLLLNCHIGEGSGMPSPYYAVTHCVNWMFGRGPRIREGFRWRSFSVRSLTLLAVRYGLRDVLDGLWRVLSRISQQEMVPTSPKDILLWRMEEGTLTDAFPDATQRWARLVADANEDYVSSLPRVLQKRKHFLPFLINVMPHRLSHRITLTLFDAQPDKQGRRRSGSAVGAVSGITAGEGGPTVRQ